MLQHVARHEPRPTAIGMIGQISLVGGMIGQITLVGGKPSLAIYLAGTGSRFASPKSIGQSWLATTQNDLVVCGDLADHPTDQDDLAYHCNHASL